MAETTEPEAAAPAETVVPEEPTQTAAPEGPTRTAVPEEPTTPFEGEWSVELDVFEGPLDLLLHLVRRHELDILDIPISFVAEKYLEYLEFMRALDIEVAGDYLVMAATLAFLKSRELLPTEPDLEGEAELLEEGVDPREELIRRLLAYQTFRAAAEDLDALPVSGRDVFGRGADIDVPPVDAGLAPVTLFRLAEAFHRVLHKAKINKSHEVVLERVSVAARMRQLTMLLQDRGTVEFDQLFLEQTWASEEELRSMLVVTFMSILELVKIGLIHVHQPGGSDTFALGRRVEDDEAQRRLAEFERGSSEPIDPTGASDAEDQ